MLFYMLSFLGGCLVQGSRLPAPIVSGQAALGQGHCKKRHLHAHSPDNFKELKCYNNSNLIQQRAFFQRSYFHNYLLTFSTKLVLLVRPQLC